MMIVFFNQRVPKELHININTFRAHMDKEAHALNAYHSIKPGIWAVCILENVIIHNGHCMHYILRCSMLEDQGLFPDAILLKKKND